MPIFMLTIQTKTLALRFPTMLNYSIYPKTNSNYIVRLIIGLIILFNFLHRILSSKLGPCYSCEDITHLCRREDETNGNQSYFQSLSDASLYPCSCLQYRYLSLDSFPSISGNGASCRNDNHLPRPCPTEKVTARHPDMAVCSGYDVSEGKVFILVYRTHKESELYELFCFFYPSDQR